MFDIILKFLLKGNYLNKIVFDYNGERISFH